MNLFFSLIPPQISILEYYMSWCKEIMIPHTTACDGSNCSSCPRRDLVIDKVSGDMICQTTGLVLSERNFVCDEVVVKDNDGHYESTYRKVTLFSPFSGYTVFNPKERIDCHQIPEAAENLKRAAKQNSIAWGDIRVIKGNQEIHRLGDELELPLYIIELIAKIYRKLTRLDYLIGRKIYLIIASLFAEMFQYYPVHCTLKDLIDAAQIINENEFRTCRRKLHLFLTKNTMIPEALIQNRSLSRTIDQASVFINKFSQELGYNYQMVQPYLRLIRRYASQFNGNAPKGITAAVLYRLGIKYHKNLSQNKICEVVGVNEITLRNNLKILYKIIAHNDKN
jgi:transcription initiation factor TFIIIB Brf1 subunit/transcription initiation factor TFIIB